MTIRLAIVLLVVAIGAVPMQARIYRGAPDSAREVVRVAGACTGVFVTRTILLSARHCCAQEDTQTLVWSPERSTDYTARVAKFDGNIALVCAKAPTSVLAKPADAPPPDNSLVVVKGYGRRTDSDESNLRRSGQAKVVEPGNPFRIEASPSVPCFGDSGGPVFRNGRLVGIVEQYAQTQKCGAGALVTAVSKASLAKMVQSVAKECQAWVNP